VKRSLSLKSETLADLTAVELAGVAGAFAEIPTVKEICGLIQPTGWVQCIPATTR
jgi:hypothetical protein